MRARRAPLAIFARVDVEAPPRRASAVAAASTPVRVARRAVRQVVRAGAWALTGAIAAPAPMLGRGDSLIVVARKS